MIYRRILAAATVCLAATLVIPNATTHASVQAALTSPKAAALQLSDVPKGFKVSTAALVSNAQMAKNVKVPLKQFTQHGRLNGFEQSFEGSNLRTYISVAANIYLYKAASGAHWDYTQGLNHELKQKMKTTAAPKIGDESTGLVFETLANKRSVTIYAIDFRKGTVDATVGVSGLTGHLTMSDAAHYARIVAGRIH